MRSTIKLAYRQIIDSSAQPGFERKIFDDTYSELQLQAKVYNREGKFTTVSEMIGANPKANSLHYKVGFAIGLYVNELQKKIPNLTDTVGKPVGFTVFGTEIIHSDIANKANHKIALTYLTDSLLLVGSFGEYLVLSDVSDGNDGELQTFTLALQPNLSIVHFSPVTTCDRRRSPSFPFSF